MNFLQLRTRVAQQCGLARSAADGAEEWQLVGDVVNEAVVDILGRTRVYIRCVDLNLTAGVDQYELGSTILKLHNITRPDGVELQEVEPGDLGRLSSGAFAILGYNRIALSWLPSAGDELEAWYTPKPTPMTADNNDPSTSTYGAIPTEFHSAIVNYASWKLSDMTGDQGSARGDKYKKWYEGDDGNAGPGTDLGRIKMAINRRGSSGSRRFRGRRDGEINFGDSLPDSWIG